MSSIELVGSFFLPIVLVLEVAAICARKQEVVDAVARSLSVPFLSIRQG